MTFGDKIKHIREQILFMTQKELAVSLGARQATINAIESGKNKTLSFTIFQKLVSKHHINPWFLLIEGPNNEPPVLIYEGSEVRSLKKKVMKYERLISELDKVKNGIAR